MAENDAEKGLQWPSLPRTACKYKEEKQKEQKAKAGCKAAKKKRMSSLQSLIRDKRG